MTTTPESPALPGDLTDETIERAAIAFTCGLDEAGREEWAQSGEEYRAMIMKDMRAAIEAAGAAPVTPSAERDEPTREEYREGYETWRTAGQRMHAALLEIWHQATPYDTSHMTFGDDPQVVVDAVAAALAPSPDREKLIEQRREALRREFEYRIRTVVAYGAMKNYRELPSQVRADFIQHEIAFAVSASEGKLAALAVPPVVNKAKLAEVLDSPTHASASTHSAHDGSCSECPWPVHQLPPEELAHVLVERQHEWQGEERLSPLRTWLPVPQSSSVPAPGRHEAH